MPDTLEATPVAPAGGGIESMIAEKWNPTPPTPPPAATPEPPKTPEASPATPPVVPKVESPAAAPVAKKEFTDAEIEAARKEKPDHKVWKILDSVKAKYSTSEATLKAELTKLQARPETPQNDAKIAELEKLIAERDERLKEREQRLEESDFTRSQSYKEKFLTPYLEEKQLAIDEVKSLTVSFGSEEEPQTRPGTENDFIELLNLGPSQQDAMARKLFGDSAHRVIDSLKTLKRIRVASEKATRDHAANFEKNRVERELTSKREREEYDRDFAAAQKGLQADPEFGSYVSESEADPEGTQLLKAELEKFDSYRETMAKMPAKDRANVAALVRARFAAEPRVRGELKRERAKNASLEAELAKFRSADPGNLTKTPVGAPAAEEPKGIEGMAASLKWK